MGLGAGNARAQQSAKRAARGPGGARSRRRRDPVTCGASCVGARSGRRREPVAHGLGGKQNRRRYDSTSQGLRLSDAQTQRCSGSGRLDSAAQAIGSVQNRWRVGAQWYGGTAAQWLRVSGAGEGARERGLL